MPVYFRYLPLWWLWCLHNVRQVALILVTECRHFLSLNQKERNLKVQLLIKRDYTRSLACEFFLSLGKIHSNQICSTWFISNPKCMSEGIPSLRSEKLHKLDIWAIFWKSAWLKNTPLKSAGAKDPVYCT